MKVKALLMRAGLAAPESGPYRNEYLRSNGEKFLKSAQAEMAAVEKVLEDYKLPVVQLRDDKEADHRHVDAVVRRWTEIRETFAEVIEEQLQEPIEAAVKNAVKALNYLEDTELRETAHELVHQASQLRFGFIGCRLRVEDGHVQSDCPVRIAHQRWGFSPEIVTEWVCSICNERFDTCPHIPDEEYEVLVDRSSNSCSACFEKRREHRDGERVVVPAQRVAKRIVSAPAVAIVARPRDPEARLTSVEINVPADSELFRQCQNETALCTECIIPCTGYIEF
ncbi:hypothetical protein, partial [Nesterenkonia massiliensis]|uniref:hypothetical protein n=1 Tax=Nesterenkonia massiliensis TaxID=1232429 RepID=UPI0005CAFB76